MKVSTPRSTPTNTQTTAQTNTQTNTQTTARTSAQTTTESEADAVIQLRRAGWRHVLMVCKACEKRSKGPKKFGAKALAKAVSPALRAAGVPKTRIVTTSCLGLCPKKAITVATVADDGRVKLIAWRKSDDPAAAVAVLFPPAVPAQPGD